MSGMYPRYQQAMTRVVRKVHGISAVVLALYLLPHIVNHIVGLGGVEAHIAFMHAVRVVYRVPVVEGLLLFCVLLQAVTGLSLFLLGLRDRRGFVPWLQACAGAYMAFFLYVHVRAVLFGRSVLHVDTNFYYAAAGLHGPSVSFHWWFATYYFLAVLCLFVHFGCAAWRRLRHQPPRKRALAVALPAAAGALIAALIVMTLAGAFYRVTIPAEYQRMPPPAPCGAPAADAEPGCPKAT
jgi:succinate dehydrogenase/fumarate reductase cytochrome b subunit